jgi:hypothetical protein
MWIDEPVPLTPETVLSCFIRIKRGHHEKIP